MIEHQHVLPDDDRAVLLAEVHRVVDLVVVAVRRRHSRRLPAIGSPAWWRAPDPAKVASLLVAAEAYLITDVDQVVAERFKGAAEDLSAALDWAAASRQPSHAELRRRRREKAA